jgi:hypothetical protein
MIGPTQQPSADIRRRSSIYLYLLHKCFWLTVHHAQLVEHYWEIPGPLLAKLGYGVVPHPTVLTVIEHEISKRRIGAHLGEVPGFYKDENGIRRLNAQTNALLIPVCGPHGHIIGIQVCLNIRRGRLYWLTSRDKPDGTPAVAYPHIANYRRVKESGVALLTNHSLRADALAYRFSAGAIGLNKCNTAVLLNMLRELSVKCILKAFDPEAHTAQAYNAIVRAIERARIKVRDAE